MKKRIFCLLLAVLMLVGAAGVFTSCGDDPGKKDPCTQHVDANKDNKCDECGEKITTKCTHEDADEDGKCDKCGKNMVGGSEVVEYPWADDEPVRLLFQMTKNSQTQALPATAERYLAGEDPTCVEEIDTMVRDRNAMAAVETNIAVSYQYYPDGDDHSWGKTREKSPRQPDVRREKVRPRRRTPFVPGQVRSRRPREAEGKEKIRRCRRDQRTRSRVALS